MRPNPFRAARYRAGITAQVVAEHCGVSRQTVSYWETGRTFPASGNLDRLCVLFPELNFNELEQYCKPYGGARV